MAGSQLHERFGKLPMKQLLAPAIAYAREGFPVTEFIAFYWDRGGATRYAEISRLHATYDDRRPGAARRARSSRIPISPTRSRRREEAAAMGSTRATSRRRIADFMHKPTAAFFRYEDLAAHTLEWVEPVSTNYRGYDVWELPPNGQGIATLEMLNILEGYDFSKIGFGQRRARASLDRGQEARVRGSRAFLSPIPDFAQGAARRS